MFYVSDAYFLFPWAKRHLSENFRSKCFMWLNTIFLHCKYLSRYHTFLSVNHKFFFFRWSLKCSSLFLTPVNLNNFMSNGTVVHIWKKNYRLIHELTTFLKTSSYISPYICAIPWATERILMYIFFIFKIKSQSFIYLFIYS